MFPDMINKDKITHIVGPNVIVEKGHDDKDALAIATIYFGEDKVVMPQLEWKFSSDTTDVKIRIEMEKMFNNRLNSAIRKFDKLGEKE